VPLPIDLRVALAPRETYGELMREPADAGWRRALERPALVAVIVGTALTLSSADRVPIGLVAMAILTWSFVPMLQLLVGAIVSGIAPARSISMARASELLFMAHLPWSLWVLVMTGLPAFTNVPLPQSVQVVSLLIPGVWTSMIVLAFCRAVLSCTTRGARWLTGLHQTMIWVLFFGYVFLVSGVWARTLALVGW
jgi:hypothetical protein